MVLAATVADLRNMNPPPCSGRAPSGLSGAATRGTPCHFNGTAADSPDSPAVQYRTFALTVCPCFADEFAHPFFLKTTVDL